MQASDHDAQTLLEDGRAALRQDRPEDAHRIIEQLISTGQRAEELSLLVAAHFGNSGDAAGEESALNRLIECEPFSVRGNIRKGDCRARARDEEVARFFYRRGLDLAEMQPIPDAVAEEVEQARQNLAALEKRSHAARTALLAQRGLPQEAWSPRFREALELAAGRRKLYLQQPTAFTYPGLPNVQFYDPQQFSWASAIEAAAPAIRAELLGLLETNGDAFRAYIHGASNAMPLSENAALLGSRDWSVLFLCENGWVVPKIVERCPTTWKTILDAPVPRVSGWGPTIVFSMLKAGARIAPHTGMFNTRLICHLPLIVPPGCGFRVGNEVRQWEEGKLMVFDDTIEHEAWNDSAEDRIVLIFDVWRPELSEQEQKELSLLFSD